MKQHVIVNVSGGEISEYAEGIVGTDQYLVSARELTNWHIRKERGIERRRGTQFIKTSYSQAAGTSNSGRLFGFQGSDASYMLEFCIDTVSSRSVVRVYDENGAVINSQGSFGYTFQLPDAEANSRYGAGNFAWASITELFDAQIDQIGNDIYIVHRNYPIIKIAYDPSASPKFGVSTCATYPKLEGNPWYGKDLDDDGVNVKSSTSRFGVSPGYFSASQIVNLRNSDKVDDICTIRLSGASQYKARPEWVNTHVLGYTGSDLDVVAKITQFVDDTKMIGVITDPSGDNTYPVVETGTAKFAPPVSGSLTTLDASSSGFSPFTSGHIGLSFMVDGGQYHINTGGIINANTATARCVRQQDNGRAGSSGDASKESDTMIPETYRTWARPAWGSNTTATYAGAIETGWPGALAFFQGRLYLGGSKIEPQTIWGSATGFYLNFATGTEDDESLSYELASGVFDDIRFIAAGTALFVGTKNGVYRLTGGDSGITPNNVFARPEISFGAARIQPVRIGPFFYMVQNGRLAIRAFSYNDSIGALVSEDVTELAGHITGTGVKQLAVESYSQTRVYGVRDDGVLCVASVFGDPSKPSWSTYKLQNWTAYNTSTDATIESCSVLKGSTGDQIWFLVARTVGGSTVRYIERISDARYLDSSFTLADLTSFGATITGTSTGLQVTGLTVLTGQAVRASIAGGDYGSTSSIVVANPFTIPLSYRATTVTPSATTGSITVTFDGSDASSSYVGETIILSGGGAITLTGYTNTTTMSGTVITTCSSTSASTWQLVTPLVIGLPYGSTIEPHRVELALRDGTAQGRKKRVTSVMARVVNTPSLYVKTVLERIEGAKETFGFRRTNQVLGAGPTAYTGDVAISIASGHDTDGVCKLYTDDPFYAAVTLIKYEVDFEDGKPTHA